MIVTVGILYFLVVCRNINRKVGKGDPSLPMESICERSYDLIIVYLFCRLSDKFGESSVFGR